MLHRNLLGRHRDLLLGCEAYIMKKKMALLKKRIKILNVAGFEPAPLETVQAL